MKHLVPPSFCLQTENEVQEPCCRHQDFKEEIEKGELEVDRLGGRILARTLDFIPDLAYSVKMHFVRSAVSKLYVYYLV